MHKLQELSALGIKNYFYANLNVGLYSRWIDAWRLC